MPASSLHAILRLPRGQRPAAAREWLEQEEARFPDSDGEPTPLPEGTGRHPLDLVLKLLPHQRPPVVRAWVEQEEPAVRKELEREARIAGRNEAILRFPTAWTRYPDFQPPSEPWIELLPNGRRLYHSQAGTTCLIPEREAKPEDSSPAPTVTNRTGESTVLVTGNASETAASTDEEAPTPQSTSNQSPFSPWPELSAGPLIDESPALERNLNHRKYTRGPTLRGPPVQRNQPRPNALHAHQHLRLEDAAPKVDSLLFPRTNPIADSPSVSLNPTG